MLITKIIEYGISIYIVYDITIFILKSKKLNKNYKINNDIKNINIINKQDKIQTYIKDEIKKITILDIKNWIPTKDIYGYKIFIDKEEAHKFSEKLYAKWSKDLKYKYHIKNRNDELNPYKALMWYSGNMYMGVNEYLRDKDKYNDNNYFYNAIEDCKDIIKNIDISFSNVPTINENIIVFRGISLANEGLKDYYYSLEEGNAIRDKAYISTSLILDIALNIHRGCVDSCSALLVIKINKGENCIFIDELDRYYEYENVDK